MKEERNRGRKDRRIESRDEEDAGEIDGDTGKR